MDQLLDKIDVQTIVTRFIAFLPNLVAAVLILLFFWIGFRVARKPLAAILHRAGLHRALVRIVISIFRFVVMVFGIIMAADQLGINVGAALAGIGIAGIAIGFAAQDSLANTMAGFMIFWDKPFEVGDWITVADQYGRVDTITMRSTRIRTNKNTYVVIPNKSIIDQVLVNHSAKGETRIDVPLGIAYKENIPRAREVLLEAVREVDGLDEALPPDVVVKELGDSSVNLMVRVWIADAKHERPVFYRVLEAGKLALDSAGIQIPYPHLQLFVDDVESRVWDGAAKLPQLAGIRNGARE